VVEIANSFSAYLNSEAFHYFEFICISWNTFQEVFSENVYQ